MTAINMDRLATDRTETWLDYTTSEYCNILDNFFTFENRPQIPFYDTPQCLRLRNEVHKEVQIKRKILEYQAKY
jgi:hypothetical protein